MAKVSKRPLKIQQVGEIAEKLRTAKVVVLTDYRGLSVAQLGDLRAKLRQADVEYHIVKNTLAKRAADDAGHPDLGPALTGPVAFALGYDDLSAPARLLGEWARSTRLKLDITGGLVEGRFFGAEQVRQLADLPPKEVLLAQLLGTLQTPIAQLVGTIQAPVQTLVGLLEAYKNKLEAA
ncbi:MAG: 50S ribosomal protein L10 [Chloroflexi bacterium]|nr:MAG: 50S ribosomal protein L10 [Chloroflexota bacterium]TMD52868.1 MAG: 50S ribosomal protein L10 [Chloroflexota bacterium]